MLNNLTMNRRLWLPVASLALITSLYSFFNQGVYSKVLDQNWLPGTVAQDLMTIFVGLVLLFLSLSTGEDDLKKQVLALSLLSYLFYGYGIFVIEQLYTPFYLLYIAICSISFWSLVCAAVNIDRELLMKITVSRISGNLIAGWLAFVALLFYVLWTSQILPLIRAGQKLEFTFSIYILDMVFVLPALLICAVLIMRKKPAGLFFAPVLFLKAFTLLFSVGLGASMKPLFGQPSESGETFFYFILSAFFLIFAVFSFNRIRFRVTEKSRV